MRLKNGEVLLRGSFIRFGVRGGHQVNRVVGAAVVVGPARRQNACAQRPAQQLASTPSTLPYIDSADVPMLLNKTTGAESAAESEPAAEASAETDAEGTTSTEAPPADATNAVQPMTMPAPLSTALPVAGTYVVSSQNGTTVQVSLKPMQDGGDAATLEGMTLDDIKALISSMIADANK